jgi:hypothetical protein
VEMAALACAAGRFNKARVVVLRFQQQVGL